MFHRPRAIPDGLLERMDEAVVTLNWVRAEILHLRDDPPKQRTQRVDEILSQIDATLAMFVGWSSNAQGRDNNN